MQAYIASMEPWQGAVVARIDALIAKQIPKVRKAIKWHCPFYGVEGQGWFLAINAFQRYVKLAFFKGAQFKPPPPVAGAREVRYLHVHEADMVDEKQVAAWIQQAAAIPGWDGGSPGAGGTSR